MDESYNINEILNSINELNDEPTKNKDDKEYINHENVNIKNISKDDVPPITDQIIKEAEEFKEKITQTKVDSKSYQKISLEMNFYKENYERLIIENNEIKNRLENAKKQLISFEENKSEINSAFENLTNVLSKSSIIGQIKPINFNVSEIKKSQDSEIE